MIAEQAALTYALLCTPVALYPRSLFRRLLPLTNRNYSTDTLDHLWVAVMYFKKREVRERGQAKAFLQLVIEGVEGVIAFMEQHDLSSFNGMTTIETYYSVAEEYYRERLALDWHYSPPRIVERYPEPAQDADWFAVSSVPGGARRGYPEGIYFLRRHIMPAVTQLATLHENTHHLGTGSKGKGGYYRYFDEGCANFLAYLVYYHKTHSLDAIRLYRLFLQEINTELYEYPSFDRIMASLIHQVGMAGFYRLFLRRLNDPTSENRKEVLRSTAAGRMQVKPALGEPADDRLPPLVEEMQAGAEKLIALITFPEPVLMSPIAYLAFDRMCIEGSLLVRDLRTQWQLSQLEAESVIKEVEGMDLWVRDGDRLRPSGRSDLFHGTGVIRATGRELLPREGEP